MNPQGTERGERRESLFFILVVLAMTAIAYGPMIAAVLQYSTRTTQAINAFLLLGFAFLDAFRSVRKTQAFRPAIHARGLLLFALSCGALALASFLSLWPLAVLGLCLNVGAVLAFCFGPAGVKPFTPAIAGLGATVGLLVFVPQADRALRLLAGALSGRVLGWMGLRTDLALNPDPFQVVLVVEKGAGVFNVAPECNGFGILLSVVVLTVILALRRRVRWLVLLPAVGVAVVLGLLFNTVRIVAITLATLRTDIPYGLIHEGLGTAVYLAALALVYGLARTLPTSRR